MIIAKHICKTSNLGINGNLFGGWMLYWLDEAAAIYAAELLKSKVITAAFKRVNFREPVKEGWMIKISGEIKEIGKTSITVSLRATTGHIHGPIKEVCECEVVLVKKDDQGVSVPIEWVIATVEDLDQGIFKDYDNCWTNADARKRNWIWHEDINLFKKIV